MYFSSISFWRSISRQSSLVMLAFILILALPAARAQNATISGQVSDETHSILPDVQITFVNQRTQTLFRAMTNRTGVFSLPFVPAGLYTLTADHEEFQHFEQKNITVNVAQDLVLNAVLTVGSTSESIVVEGNGAEINTTNASLSTVIGEHFVENVPLNGRSFQSLLTLVPGVTSAVAQGPGFSGEVTVNGQRTEANSYIVDGVSANTGALTISNSSAVGRGAGFSGSTPAQSALGTTQGLVSLDALQEFRATTSTYSAEYGRTPGGQFSFNTRSGTNQFHGTLFNYFRNDVLDANNWFNNANDLPRQAERQNDFGGTFGGPVILPHLYQGRDRTFYFFSYEGLRLRTPQAAVTSDVPGESLRAAAPSALQPFLNAFPKANGIDEGNGLARFTATYSTPSQLDAVSLRMDHSVGPKLKLFGRFSYAPSSSSDRETPNLANISAVKFNTKTTTAGVTYVPNSHMANEFRFGGTWNNSNGTFTLSDFGGATPLELSSIPGLDTPNANLFLYLNFGLRPVIRIVPRKIDQSQYNVVDSLAITLGRHMLKFGIDWRAVRNDEPLPSVYEYPVFANQAQILTNTPSFISIFRFRGESMAPVYQNFSAYMQDEWKVNPRLSVSAGLRWEVNPAPYDANGNDPYTIDQVRDLSTSAVAPEGTALWKTRWNSLAPRLGLAYQVHAGPKYQTVLRGGAGLFYDTGNTLGTMGYWGLGVVARKTYTGVSAPASQELVDDTPLPSLATPYENTLYAFDPDLRLPRTMQWNITIEQMLGSKQTFRVGYVGSAGRQLLLWQEYYPGALGNTNFSADGSTGNSLELTTNGSSSKYSALQAQFQSRPIRGFQALASYTWSHSIDNASTSFQTYQVLKASSDFDVRNNLQAALSYEIPSRAGNPVLAAAFNNWGLDSRISMRSALPIDVVGSTLLNESTGSYMPLHPNLVPGQPLYIYTSAAPGGKMLNFNAFEQTESLNGTAGRNIARGFDAIQTDLALRREFRLFGEAQLQFRAEAFNVFNHAIFGGVYNDLTYGESLFGLAYSTMNAQLGGLNALYQTGGPRSLQLAMKLHF